jgi:hypothetical protein
MLWKIEKHKGSGTHYVTPRSETVELGFHF